MDQLIGIIVSFPAGVICAPLLIFGLGWFLRRRLHQNYTTSLDRINTDHIEKMQHLHQEWNKILDQFNRREKKLRQKLADNGLFIESDDTGEIVLVKRVPLPAEKRR
jgi:hypothetical protein